MRILNDILDFSKIEAGKLKLEVTDFYLDDLLADLRDLYGLKVREKGLELLFDLHPDCPRALRGDPLRLNQVITNLLSNAIKFTEQGEILLKIEPRQRVDDRLELQFSLKDTGIGMTAEQKGGLFRSFSQADSSTTRKYGGTGLGLAISRSLVELMGGEIGVESQPGEGTTFWFRAIFEAGKPRSGTPGLPVSHLKVLAVDDNQTAREVMASILGSFDYQVTTSRSGPEALELWQRAQQEKVPFDLVLLDWKMPGMTGVEVAQQLLNQPSPPRVVLVTAYDREELREQTQGLGLAHILTKPVTASDLYDTIANAYGYQGSARHHRERASESDWPQLKGTRVLLVEDNLINQEIAVELLKQAGIVPEVAENGQVALQKLEQHDFDAVLMDMQMPVMDGLRATEQARSRGFTLPIIAMTANVIGGDRERCLAAGMNDHLGKPTDVGLLYATLARWITGDQQTPQADSAGLSQEVYERLLNKFLDQNQDFCQSFPLDDPEAGFSRTHSLAGVAGNLRLDATYQLARQLENACQQRARPAELTSLLTQLKQALASIPRPSVHQPARAPGARCRRLCSKSSGN